MLQRSFPWLRKLNLSQTQRAPRKEKAQKEQKKKSNPIILNEIGVSSEQGKRCFEVVFSHKKKLNVEDLALRKNPKENFIIIVTASVARLFLN